MTELDKSTISSASAVTFLIDFKDFSSVTYTKQGKTTTEVPIIASLSECIDSGQLPSGIQLNLTVLVDEKAFFQPCATAADKQLYAQGLMHWFKQWQSDSRRNGAFASAQLQLQFFSLDGNRIQYSSPAPSAGVEVFDPQGKVFAFSSDSRLRAALSGGGIKAAIAVVPLSLEHAASDLSIASVASAINVNFAAVKKGLPQAAVLAASRQQLSRPRVVTEATAEPDRGLSFS